MAGLGAVRMERPLLAYSQQMRRLDCLTFSSAARPAAGRRRRAIMVVARVHPGETPASFAAAGLLEFLVGGSPQAAALLEAATVTVVPMLNPDGVALGNYRCDAGGRDLNREWASPTADTAPTIAATLHEALRLAGAMPDAEADSDGLELFIDIHAHSTARQSFFYLNPKGTWSRCTILAFII